MKKTILSILFMFSLSLLTTSQTIYKPITPSAALIPPSGQYNYFFNSSASNLPYLKKSDNTIVPFSSFIGAGGGGSGVWGTISGTLSSQTDLMSALNAKQNTITLGTTSQYLRGDLSLSTFPSISGTTNYLPKFTSSTDLGNSIIRDNGTVAAIGMNVNTTIGTGAYMQVFESLASVTGNSTFYLFNNGGVKSLSAYNYFTGQYENFTIGNTATQINCLSGLSFDQSLTVFGTALKISKSANTLNMTGGTSGFTWADDASSFVMMSLSDAGALTLGSIGNVGAFKYVDGNQAANKVLTSDIDGNSTWQTPSTALGYTAENVANKATDLSSNDYTHYPTTAAVQTAINSAVTGQDYKEACRYATTSALPTVVYSNGSSGVGATITAVSTGSLSIDGSTPTLNSRVLIKNQASTFQNGVYVVTATGSGVALFVLTRAVDFDQTSEILTGDASFVTLGATQSATTWVVTSDDNPIMGTDAIVFAQTSGQGSLIAGTGIKITGTTITASVVPNSSLQNPATTINGVSIALGASGTVASAASTLTGTVLASGVTASSITTASLSALTTGYGMTGASYNGNSPIVHTVDTSGSNGLASKLYTAAKYAVLGSAITIETEQSTTPVSDNTESNGLNSLQFGASFTLPTTYKYYQITGIEWKNGATVTGSVSCGVQYVDANPPVNPTTVTACLGMPIAQSGTSVVQRNSAISPNLILGGTNLWGWLSFSSGSATARYQSGLSSVNIDKNPYTYTTTPAYTEAAAWFAGTNHLYVKIYYKGIN